MSGEKRRGDVVTWWRDGVLTASGVVTWWRGDVERSEKILRYILPPGRMQA